VIRRILSPALWLIVPAVTLLAGTASAQNISFSGTVTMQDGTPVKDALIQAMPSTEARSKRSAKTKKDGSFKIPYAEFGRYRIKASKEGLLIFSVSISVRQRNNRLDYEDIGELGPQQTLPEYDLQPGRRGAVDFVMVPESFFARFLTVAGDAEATERLMQANSLTGEGKYAESDAILVDLLEQGATSASVHYLRGLNAGALGNTEQAVLSLEKTLELNPEQPGANAQLGIIAVEAGQNERAAELFDRELEISPDAVPVAINRAVVLGRLGRQDEAIEAFEQVIEMDPGQVDAYSELANIYTGLGEDAKAEEVLDRMEGVATPDPALWFNLGANASNQDRYDHARTCYLKAVSLDPTFGDAIRELGYLEIRAGDQPRALEYFDRYLELKPDAADAGQIQALRDALAKNAEAAEE